MECSRFAAKLNMNVDIEYVSAPTLAITTKTVDAALPDAKTLIKSHGPSSGVERPHTILHGYLKTVCCKTGIAFKEGASVTELFGRIRNGHPTVQSVKPETKQRVDNTIRRMEKIMDALDPIRNQNSLGRPNTVLLDDAEAMLAINLMRTMLHYLNDRIGPYPGLAGIAASRIDSFRLNKLLLASVGYANRTTREMRPPV